MRLLVALAAALAARRTASWSAFIWLIVLLNERFEPEVVPEVEVVPEAAVPDADPTTSVLSTKC